MRESVHSIHHSRSLDLGAFSAYVQGVRLALFLLLISCQAERGREFHGVRLGMTAEQVRSAFDQEGSFSNELLPEGAALRFVPHAHAGAPSTADVRSSTFEFHSGVLVGMHAETRTAPFGVPKGARFTSGAVFEATEQEGTFRVRWVARNCPGHAAEAEALVRRAQPL
jgi:hypothetical protein